MEGNLGRGPGRSCCSHPYCKDEEMKLCFNGGNDLDSLGLVYSISILNILTQIKANSAFRAAGGGHRRLSLQNRMRCLQLPPLPGDWVSSASSTLCAGTLHLLQLKKNPKHSSGYEGCRHFRDLGSEVGVGDSVCVLHKPAERKGETVKCWKN